MFKKGSREAAYQDLAHPANISPNSPINKPGQRRTSTQVTIRKHIIHPIYNLEEDDGWPLYDSSTTDSES